MHDLTLDRNIARCGFCGSLETTCVFRFRSGKRGAKHIDLKKSSGCRVFCREGITSFRYATAAQFLPNSPCSNVPIYCPRCEDTKPLVWKYSLQAHLKRVHGLTEESVKQYEDLYNVSKEEEAKMGKVFDDRFKKSASLARKKKATAKQMKSMKISEAHSSRLGGTGM